MGSLLQDESSGGTGGGLGKDVLPHSGSGRAPGTLSGS